MNCGGKLHSGGADPLHPVELSHLFLEHHLEAGDTAVDCTAGNGYDTAFLARLVGEGGRVLAFDIQGEALERTRRRLERLGFLERVRLIHDGHENLDRYLAEPAAAMVFNLGYLPGGDRGVITRPETTLAALEAGLKLLLPGGIIVFVIYTGHAGGDDERRVLLERAGALDEDAHLVFHCHFPNLDPEPAQLLIIRRRP